MILAWFHTTLPVSPSIRGLWVKKVRLPDTQLGCQSRAVHDLSWYYRRAEAVSTLFLVMLRILFGILFTVWLVLVFLGKGGFVHLLLLTALGVASVEIMTVYRARLKQ